MRVLSVQHYATFGGPTNEIVTMDAPLRAQGIETIVAINWEPGDALPRLRDSPVPTYAIPLSRLRITGSPLDRLDGIRGFRRDIRHLRGLIRHVRPDLVKVHGPHNPQGAVAAASEGLPKVWVVSSTRVPPLLRGVGGAIVAAAADAILVNGKALIDAYPQLASVPEKVFTYYPPVDVSRFVPVSPPERLAIQRALGISGERPLVLTVANVNPQKGIEVFIETARRIGGVMDCEFAVVGGVAAAHEDYLARLKVQAAEAGLADRLYWLGARRDVERVVAAADVKMITSRPESEGTTTTAGEAMACCIPVVATDVGAVSEVVEHGGSGYLVAPDDAQALADAAVDLLASPDLRRSMGQRGRDIVVQRFSAEACAAVHARAYARAVADRPA